VYKKFVVSVQIESSRISGIVRCPPSKSYSHRATAIGSLTTGQSVINNVLIARDTLATIRSCSLLGVRVRQEDTTLFINGQHSFDPPENVLDAENSGTTIRILTAMSALVKEGYTVITGDESLRKRPMQPILDALKQLGVECYSAKMNGTAPLIIKGGGIRGGLAILDGRISSQFLSSLLMSSIFSASPVTIRIFGDQVSKPYVEATLASMKVFGVTIDYEPKLSEYYVEDKRYAPTTFNVPADFSTAALIMAAGVLAGDKVKIEGLDFGLPQADKSIIEIIKMMGGKIKIDKQKGHAIVFGSCALEGGDFDLRDAPDLLPVVSILALKAKSQVKISGIGHARFKETDRVAAISSELTKFGAIVKQDRDMISITPPKTPKNASLDASNDHRLFMAFTIASMITEKSTVTNAESVDVSYPDFIKDMTRLNACISTI
jgi:3-phosphoshikimate 1-carboxyvinyltransferase